MRKSGIFISDAALQRADTDCRAVYLYGHAVSLAGGGGVGCDPLALRPVPLPVSAVDQPLPHSVRHLLFCRRNTLGCVSQLLKETETVYCVNRIQLSYLLYNSAVPKAETRNQHFHNFSGERILCISVI